MSLFERMTFLEYKLKAAENEIAAFRSGKKYIQMEQEHNKLVKALYREIKDLKALLADSRLAQTKIQKMWQEVLDDILREMERAERKHQKELKAMEQRALRAEKKLDDANDKITEQRRQLYEVGTRLEDALGKIVKLTAQLNHDYENSSIPSSLKANKKKISNNRESTGRRPGAQPGHPGHGRKKQSPTQTVVLPVPEEILDDPDFKLTKKTLTKQLVKIHMTMEVIEYQAAVYRNSRTGETVHAPFPEGVVDDVNYDGSVKAFLFLLNNECCVSIDKSRRMLSELTAGKLNISKGMINKLSKEFSDKSKAEQKEILHKVMSSPVLHTDCTNARENGNNAYVFISVTPEGEAIYSASHKKGFEGVAGTPVQDYMGILVHDHEKTFFSYGSAHQECLAHVLRYLKDSIQNEPGKTWSGQMRALLQEMIHYRNGLSEGTQPDAERVKIFEKRYSEILDLAEQEYLDEPASDYYRDGYNLFKRMKEYQDAHLLFLHDGRVPATNNAAERMLRSYKRKQKQAVSFRSYDSIDRLCQCMSVLLMMRKNDENLFDQVSAVFG